jgi:hypothetical protein
MIQLGILTSDIGYLNLIRAGYLHRDISIGNVLWKEGGRMMATIQDKDVSLLLQNRAICTGFVIDGDMAVELGAYIHESGMETQPVRCPC